MDVQSESIRSHGQLILISTVFKNVYKQLLDFYVVAKCSIFNSNIRSAIICILLISLSDNIIFKSNTYYTKQIHAFNFYISDIYPV